jgi:tetratricopeptide (TPR) repeat protein
MSAARHSLTPHPVRSSTPHPLPLHAGGGNRYGFGRSRIRRLLAAAALLSAACAGQAPRPVAPTAPEEYIFPVSRPGDLSPKDTEQIEKAWKALLYGDARQADKDLSELLRRRPALIAGETALAYARLRQARLEEARRGFAAVLERRPDYVSALYGAALGALRAGEAEPALDLLRRAEAADPGNALVSRRFGEVRLQVTEKRVSAARAELAAGQADLAIETYKRALADAPELAELRLELANVLIDRGETTAALELLETDPVRDRQILLRLGEVHLLRNEHARALDAYRRLLLRDPQDEEAQRRSKEVRQAMEALRMPEEYQRIGSAPTIARADLAALVAVKVTALARVSPGPAKVAVDISGSWAREHIIKALSYDVMTVYPNHTFQPGATVRRGDLALAVQRILDLLSYPGAAGPAPTDMSPSNLYHYPATRVVAAGLMDVTPSGAFEAWRPVSGQEAVEVLESLIRRVGP